MWVTLDKFFVFQDTQIAPDGVAMHTRCVGQLRDGDKREAVRSFRERAKHVDRWLR